MQQVGGFGETLATGYGQRAASFDHWEIAFREAYMLKERTRHLLDDSLNDYQNREESVGILARRKE